MSRGHLREREREAVTCDDAPWALSYHFVRIPSRRRAFHLRNSAMRTRRRVLVMVFTSALTPLLPVSSEKAWHAVT